MTATRHAPNGMVCSVDHLASEAGVSLLRIGGNAVDAAIAANAVLAVTAPHLCGLGGDLFALVHDGSGAPATLNASGRAGAGADADELRREGHRSMPFSGDIRAVPVPGCVDGWVALHDRFGSAPLADVLAPARDYAAAGFPASPLLAATAPLLQGVDGADDFALALDRPMRAGDLVRRPGVARCLAAVAADGRAGFYEGEFGHGLLRLGDGHYAADDLRRPNADWVEPLRVEAWGHVLWTVPPNSQGYLTLLGAAIATGLDLPDDPADAGWAHLLVEAARAAGHDRPDVLAEGADVGPLLQRDEVAQRRGLVDPERRRPMRTLTAGGGTMYLCAVDHDRLGVSLIQSNASGFGSGLWVREVGVNLQNRGIGFSLEPGHPAEYGPGRRPPHTLSPALVSRADGSLRAVIGSMGGDSQPQILLQLLARLLAHHQSPGRAIEAPRWVLRARDSNGFNTWTEPDDVVVQVEAAAEASWADGLREHGHDVDVVAPGHGFGHAHVVDVADDGSVLRGAADPRALVGAAAGY
jgi:gamma-glutamyltranspeptidase/glutathione hydrolase